MYDVTGNKAYGPEGGYKSKSSLHAPLRSAHLPSPRPVRQTTPPPAQPGAPQRSILGSFADAPATAAVFAGHDASRALAKTSLKPEDVRAEWEDLGEAEKKTLDDWDVFFGKRYNVVGRVVAG